MGYFLPNGSRRYDRYEARMQSLGGIVRAIRKHPILSTLALLVLLGSILAFLLTIGSFSGEARCEDFVYGDAPACSLTAFLSPVRYQYAATEGEPVWSYDFPTTLGTYRIRAVSRNGLGIPRYSQSMTFTLLPRQLDVQIVGHRFVYGDYTDETPKAATEYLGLAPGDSPAPTYISEERSSGDRYVSLKDIQIYNNKGQNVTPCYQITSQQGRFIMTPRPITVTAENAEKVYDGLLFREGKGAISQGTIVPSDTLNMQFGTSPAEVGTYLLSPVCTITNANGENVTERYSITVVQGKLTILPRELTFETGSAEKVFDGKPLTNPEWSLVSGEIPEGHELIVTVTGQKLTAGEGINSLNVSIYNQAGVESSENFKILMKAGKLKIIPIDLTFTTGSAEKVYDGNPLINRSWELVSGKLLSGHTMTCTTSGSQTSVGAGPNTLKVLIEDKDGTSVTDGYRIQVDFGILTVTPRPITITSESAEKPYDGTPLICHVFQTDPFLKTVSQQVSGSNFTGIQLEVGSSANTFTVTISDNNGLETTENYDITYVYGTLTVTPSQGGDGGGGGGGSIGMPSPGENIGIGFPDVNSDLLFATVDGIYGSGMLYFRATSYGDYTGKIWIAPPQYQSNYAPLEFVGYNRKDNVAVRISLINDTPTLLPYFPCGTDFSDGSKGDSYYQRENSAYSVYLTTGYSYQDLKNMQVDPYLSLEELMYQEYVHGNYLQIPDYTKNALLSWAKAQGIHANSPTLVEDIQNAVRNGATYNLYGDPYPEGVDVAVYFLTRAKEGICQHFATAATMVYRAFGIPARYTVGFVADVAEGETTYLTSQNAHAWVEIYVDGLGWIPMEVTGSSTTGPNNKINLNVGAYSATKIYDGKGFDAYDLERYSILYGQLREGHRLSVTFDTNSSPVTVGTYKNNILRCVVYDEKGNDVTSQYNLQTIPGTLTILPRPLTVATGSATKVYDGKPLTCSDYWISEGSLAPNQELIVTTEVSIDGIGWATNTPTEVRIVWKDRSGKWVDVTDCYEIRTIAGKLEIINP